MPAPRNNPYQQAQKLGSNPRETESRALLESARRLRAVQQPDADLEAYRTALRTNWRLWTLFQTDIAEAQNPLPDEIKRNMLSLCAFVDRQTISALSRVAPASLQVLIDINRHIAMGLAGSTSEGETVRRAEPPNTLDQPTQGLGRFVA